MTYIPRRGIIRVQNGPTRLRVQCASDSAKIVTRVLIWLPQAADEGGHDEATQSALVVLAEDVCR